MFSTPKSPSLIDIYQELAATKGTLYSPDDCAHNVAKFYHHLQQQYPRARLEQNMFVTFFHNNGNGAMHYGKNSFAYHVALLYFDSEKNDWYLLDYDAPSTLEERVVSTPITANNAIKKMFAKTNNLLTCLNDAIAQYPQMCYRAASINQMMIFSLSEWDKVKDMRSLDLNIPRIEQHTTYFTATPEQERVMHDMGKSGLSFIN